MMRITINVEENDAAYACREVANAIENGYYSGIVGTSGDDWWIDDLDK